MSGLLSVGGCSQSIAQVVQAAQIQGLQVEIVPAPSPLPAGGTVDLSIRVANVTADPITIDSCPFARYSFGIVQVGPQAHNAVSWDSSKAAPLDGHMQQPCDGAAVTYAPGKFEDLALATVPLRTHDGAALPPGDYEAVIEFTDATLFRPITVG